MGSSRSGMRWRLASAAAGIAAVAAGVAGMAEAARLARRLGLGVHATLITAELALAAAALLAAVVLRVRLHVPGSAPAAWRAPLAGVALWVTGLGVVGLQQLVWSPPPGYLDAFMGLHQALRPDDVLGAAASLAAIAIAPGLCEELLFRGVALPALTPLLGSIGAALGSAALFGLIHMDLVGDGISLYRVPFAFAVGLGLAAVRLRSGSLVPAVLAHSVLNATTWAVVALLAPELDRNGDTAGPLLLALAQLVAGVSGLVLLLRGWPSPGAAPRR